MDEELQIKQQLTQVPFNTLLAIDHSKKEATKKTTQLPQKLKGGYSKQLISPMVRDARKPLPKYQPKIQKFESRDPRFDSTAGDLSLGKFYKSYDFIQAMKQKEINLLDQTSNKLDPESKSKVKQIIGKSKDELKKRDQMLKKEQTVSKLKKANFHPKKSMIKEELLKQKYDDLEANGKLDAFMKLKKKSLAKKLDFASKKIKK